MFKYLLRFFFKPKILPGALKWAWIILILFTLISFPGYGQVGVEYRTIYVSGQINNDVNGAPVPNHQIIILSDSVTNNGFYFYSTLYTDVNGFYFDTVITNLNYGSLNISLYDFEYNLHEADKYYRFNWSVVYQMFADFQIFDPNATSEFQANFDVSEDTLTGNPLKMKFHDLSIAFVIKSWSWDFGDGNQSLVQDPEHEYAEPGTYMVTLTITGKPPQFEVYDTSTITKQVAVGLADYYNMGGHVIADYFPIDYGLAYLYMVDEEEITIPIDTAVIDTLGYYFFYQIIEGDYIVKSRLQVSSIHYGDFIPTYYGNSYVWDEADIIELREEGWGYHIDLITSDGINNGDGQICGTIGYDTSSLTTNYIPAENIEIILLNNTSICLNCKLSDLEGYFRFGEIAFGTYQIYPDVTGIHTEPMYITISEEEPGNEEITVVIQDEEITFGIDETGSEFIEDFGNVYPNPVKDQARLNIFLKKSGMVNVFILDQKGQLIWQKALQMNKGQVQYLFSTAAFSAGIYTIGVVTEDEFLFSRKFIKVN